MSKVPFTSDGVNFKQQQLYALSDADLIIEVKAIQNDFAAWMEQNFYLSPLQKAYIVSAPDRAIWGAQIGAVVCTRGPIVIPTPPKDYGPAYRTKETRIKITGETTFTPPVSGVPKIQGTLKATVEFTLVV
ncbi:hypothetical protein SAMN04488128_103731 [Chitinophaga eiseniae]|uniref:Uncharacterized protein n=1 Tax=Chitinophaga eiseniae TaxID=634771 RepID=A0A1T4SY94_9BACT|nr:hypothetical protein [Chitinophaga eiseniae]SKA32888.1 hypothetical protein SAMN04488128_103731 [Chitinophaga eiseniae]